MKKLLIIGIDALDPVLLSQFIDDLPTFKHILEKSPKIKSASIFPPDSISAWTSIHTGLNPANHGIVDTLDFFNNTSTKLTIDENLFKGKTFWDIAGKNGKKVCIVFPQAAFPPWEVNGIMVSKSIYGEVQTYPRDILNTFNIPDQWGQVGGHPGNYNLKSYFSQAKKAVIDEQQLGLKLMKVADWDLFFIYFSELDMISHFFWKYYDKTDPAYPGNTSFENYLLDFYKLHDAVVSEFMKHLDQNVSLMIISDHGHGMRPPRTININEILRNFGYLKSKNKTYSDKYNIVFSNVIKNRLMPIVKRIGGEEIILRIAKTYPKSRDIYKSLNIIDHENSIAYLSSFTGSKTYYYGGIEINKKIKSTQADYEKIRNDLIRDLDSVINPVTDKKIINWICKKEDLYQGKYIEKYPDIIFELNDNFGIGWDVHNDIVGISLDHALAPGGHKNEAVFLINDETNSFSNQTISIMDIAPTILDILQVPHSQQFDGKILKKGEF